MSSWLSDLEKRKKEEEKEKRRQEQAQKTRQEQEAAQALQLYERYRVHIDYIHEQVKQLVSRANAAGLTDLKTYSRDFIKIDYSRSSEGGGHLGKNTYTSDRSISIILEKNGQIKLYYLWATRYKGVNGYESGSEHSECTLPLRSGVK